jgi:hypothetical protein
MATHEVRVDYARSLGEQPETGHNRWHPDIAPVATCDPGDEVVLDTRDAFDGQMGPQATLDTVAAPNLNVVHPLTGPVYVNGAEPGDLLEVEILEVEPDRYGYTVQVPGFGFLRDTFPDPYMARWRIEDGWATSLCPPSTVGWKGWDASRKEAAACQPRSPTPDGRSWNRRSRPSKVPRLRPLRTCTGRLSTMSRSSGRSATT